MAIIYSESTAGSEYPSVKERINKQETLGYGPLVNQTEEKTGNLENKRVQRKGKQQVLQEIMKRYVPGKQGSVIIQSSSILRGLKRVGRAWGGWDYMRDSICALFCEI